MSDIRIQKISIVDVDTDAIVNAANEGLWPGSGVCGAIFEAAGYKDLQAACNKIGYCKTGSAVITPGFRMKAKYIIHAVGPIWDGGGHGEPEQLYGAYRRSLELAVENGCASIGFPLISAGVFGYPTDLAWETALKACGDFLAEGNQIDIVFAVLDERILNMGQDYLEKVVISSKKTADNTAGSPMKILVLKSSGNKHGSSNALADEFIRGAKEAGHEITEYDVFRADIRPCIGCNHCETSGPCIQKDDFERDLKGKIKETDMIVFVMPVYYYNWPAQLKVVVDRFYSFTFDLTAMHKKTALIGAAWDDTDTVFSTVTGYYRQLCDYMEFQDLGVIEGKGCGTPEMTKNSRCMKDAYELGRRL